jgi:hypothetical protein
MQNTDPTRKSNGRKPRGPSAAQRALEQLARHVVSDHYRNAEPYELAQLIWLYSGSQESDRAGHLLGSALLGVLNRLPRQVSQLLPEHDCLAAFASEVHVALGQLEAQCTAGGAA